MEHSHNPFTTRKKFDMLSGPTSQVRRDVSDVLISSFTETTTFLTFSTFLDTSTFLLVTLGASREVVTTTITTTTVAEAVWTTTQVLIVFTTITPTLTPTLLNPTISAHNTVVTTIQAFPTAVSSTHTPTNTHRLPLANVSLVAALLGSLGVIVIILVGLCVIWYLRRKRSQRTEVTSTASPDGARSAQLFGGEGRWGRGLFRGKTTAAISAPSEDTLSHEHDVEQSGPMIRRASLNVEDSGQTDSEKPEENMSTRASYGGPHPDPPDPPPVPSLSPPVFGRSAAMTSEVSAVSGPISGRRPRQEEDGGVRIAGGRSGADDQSIGDTGSLHTLPPPYNDYL
ncbi:hypothetical protein PHLCEN_2v4182 [Hermanssonia centrifuga]|uniref:Uncharacterized protein n=1 Tax=Hermanssonia centrifuga TaxID=98765 RepID=A0A2R6PZ42_9APHY|nr:hypothetical protein PHLCEN_2v4182 [Hermanssonia centrifuga]